MCEIIDWSLECYRTIVENTLEFGWNSNSKDRSLMLWINPNRSLYPTEFGLFHYILIFLCGLVQISVAMETMGITYILPVAECDLKLNATRKGILAGTTFVGAICSSHLWGYLADTKGRRRIIQPTLLVAFLVSVASSFIQDFYLFTGLRFMNGFLWVSHTNQQTNNLIH